MDLHGLPLFFMDFYGFQCIWRGSGARMFGGLWQPVPPCGGLWWPVAADWIPYKKHFRRTGGLDLKAWCLDAWMLAGLKGFEEVADRWEEGIGRTEDLRTSHTLDALGGRRISFVESDRFRQAAPSNKRHVGRWIWVGFV